MERAAVLVRLTPAAGGRRAREAEEASEPSRLGRLVCFGAEGAVQCAAEARTRFQFLGQHVKELGLRWARTDYGFGPVGDLGVAENIGDVVADGLTAEAETFDDLSVVMALSESQRHALRRASRHF